MTNSQEDTNGSQAQIMPPGTISQNVPDEKPEPFESDSYNKGGVLPIIRSGSSKLKRKPIDWIAIVIASARTGLITLFGTCVVLAIGLVIILGLWLLVQEIPPLGVGARFGLGLILIALIGAGAGAWDSYNKQRNP